MQVHARLARDNFGDGSFAGAGRAEENHIGKVLLGAHAAQHAAFADKVRLADNLVKALRTYPVGKRARHKINRPFAGCVYGMRSRGFSDCKSGMCLYALVSG
jgi:hypothetical protein